MIYIIYTLYKCIFKYLKDTGQCLLSILLLWIWDKSIQNSCKSSSIMLRCRHYNTVLSVLYYKGVCLTMLTKTVVRGIIGICTLLWSSQMLRCISGNLYMFYSKISLPAT